MFEVEIRGAVGGVERRGGLVGCEKDKVVEVVVVCAAVDIRMVISLLPLLFHLLSGCLVFLACFLHCYHLTI